MEFRILGPLQALDDGQPVALGGSKQRALLALLLLHVNEPLSTERLIDELWGDRPPAMATKALQVHVARLRKALTVGDAAGVVATRERGYELTLAPDRIDAFRFDRLVAEGRAALAAGEPRRAEPAFAEALALFRGPPLADLAHEPFARHHIDRLDDLRVGALEQLIETKLALGRDAEVVERLDALIVEHPYRERFRAQQMLALYRCDRQADALQAYRDARATLSENLGIEPGERLRALERAILAQDPALLASAQEGVGREQRPLARDLPSPLRIPAGMPLVGREAELERLHRLWVSRPGLVLVAGEAGIGKTRLAAELARAVHDAQGLVLYGRCDERLAVPYQPFVDALRPAADLVPSLTELHTPAERDPETERLVFFDAVLFAVEAVTRGRRAVLVLDDFHWAPPPTQMLLRHLILSPRPLDALIIVTYRDTDLAAGHPLDDLPPDVRIERITLGGLDERAIATLLDTAPALKRRRPDLASRLHDETNGNPFFVREVLAHLVESGEIEAPDQLRDVIARRVARLSESAQAVLTVAAVAGPTFSVAVVERAVGEQADLLDAFDEATAAGLLTEQGHGDYAFAHALVRQTIYRGLSSARRARLHRRVGEALEAVVDRDANVEALAYHFAEAAADGQADKAADYALAAGRRASRRLAYELAAAHYQRGLDALALADRPDAKRRRELLRELGRTHYEPLPDIWALPAWIWRRLPRAAKVGVALLPVVGIALVVALGPGIERGKREAERADAQRLARNRAEYIARVTAEQRPHRSRGAPAGSDRAARARLLQAAATSVGADARARAARGRRDGPILRVECAPYPRTRGAQQDSGARVGRYDCLAVTAEIPATARSAGGATGHGYRVVIDFQTGRYVHCKVMPAAGKALRSVKPFVPLPRGCGEP